MWDWEKVLEKKAKSGVRAAKEIVHPMTPSPNRSIAIHKKGREREVSWCCVLLFVTSTHGIRWKKGVEDEDA